MKSLFLASIVAMFAHKVESWWAAEWLESPFFQALERTAQGLDPVPTASLGETIFLVFVTWLFVGLLMGWLVLRGGWGPIVALAFWGATFVLEWHHLGRAILRGGYYPGLVTSLVYLAIMAAYWGELLKHLPTRSAQSGPS